MWLRNSTPYTPANNSVALRFFIICVQSQADIRAGPQVGSSKYEYKGTGRKSLRLHIFRPHITKLWFYALVDLDPRPSITPRLSRTEVSLGVSGPDSTQGPQQLHIQLRPRLPSPILASRVIATGAGSYRRSQNLKEYFSRQRPPVTIRTSPHLYPPTFIGARQCAFSMTVSHMYSTVAKLMQIGWHVGTFCFHRLYGALVPRAFEAVQQGVNMRRLQYTLVETAVPGKYESPCSATLAAWPLPETLHCP
ncbi:hypothetical protein BDW22DRAFT_1344310 [Trametopsis cervina]|nr:hypothetical protein BDW22DRAFT_1344310 [Trametopsis cervina]